MRKVHLLCLILVLIAVGVHGCGRSSPPPSPKESELSYMLKLVKNARTEYGDDHPRTLTVLSSLADWYEDQGRYEDAIRIQQERVDTWRRKFGVEHFATLASIGNLGRVYSKHGDYATAETLFRELLDVRKRVNGARHEDTLAGVEPLADVLLLQEKYEDAQQHLLELFHNIRGLHGDSHAKTLGVCDRLISMYEAWGKDTDLAKWRSLRAELEVHGESPENRAELVPDVRVPPAGTDAKPLDSKLLIEIAKRHGLPMPPAEARLVLAHTESWRVIGGRSTSRDPGIYSPAYLLNEEPNGSIRILRGTEQAMVQTRNGQGPHWVPFSADEFQPRLGGYVASFSHVSAFVCAVQTAALGDEDTAQAIWKRFSSGGGWNDSRRDEDDTSRMASQRLLLGRCLFDHLRNALLEAVVDQSKVYVRMTDLMQEFPQLNAGRRGEMVKDLATTVKINPPNDASVEQLLLDWASRPSRMRHLGMYDELTEFADAPARKILSRGFEAVPQLIALLKDRRVTTHEEQAFMHAPARIKRLGELARELVCQIAGDKSFPTYGDDVEAILAWWENVQTQDEPVALTRGVFRRQGERITGVNEGVVRIVAAKYPNKLHGLCEEFTARALPDAQPYAVAEAIAESTLPRETRVQTLSKFAEQGSLEHKRCVLQTLAKLDGHACSILLLPVLHQLPEDTTRPYWTCPEAGFTHVVVQLEDDGVWQTYLRVAKRSSVGLRMEMMNPLNYAYIGELNLNRRLAFLSAFLGDQTIRTMSGVHGQFEGPCAGFTIRRLAVRDFAAMKLASLLAMKETPDEFWTEAQWEELRRKVTEELAERQQLAL